MYALVGFLMGPIWGFIIATTTKTFASQSGVAAGILSVGGGAGASLFPVILGAVADGFGFRFAIGLLAALALFICVIGMLRKNSTDS